MSESQTLHALSRNTISLIGSCQVITSVYSVVKELIENSLDANASSVDIKLDDFGLEKIYVCDNGSGIKVLDVPFMAKRHFTSKISSSEDLNSLTTYGFRGEALGSLCAVSHMTITTKTAEDQLGYVYTIGPDGDVLDKKPSHNGKGTIVSSKSLFYNIPVRKQYYNGSQRKKDDLKRIELLLMMYAIVKPDLRLTLKHGKDLVFQKTALKDVKTALLSVLGRQIANQMLYKEKCCEDLQIKVCAYLPKPGSDVKDLSLASADKTFIAVNKRPVFVPELNRVLKSYYSNCHGLDGYRYPVCFVSLDVAPNHVDVNVDPNKTKVFFQQKADIIIALEEILVEIYGPLENVPSWHYREPDDETHVHKEKDTTPVNKVKNTMRPFITYSKRPGDSETSGNESSDKNETETSTPDGVVTKNATSLPLFSMTFHSKPSHGVESQSNVKDSNSPVESLDTNIASNEIVKVANESTENTKGCTEKSMDCDIDDNFHLPGKETNAEGEDQNEISKEKSTTDVASRDELNTSNNNTISSSLLILSGNKALSNVQEVTVIENEETNDAVNEDILSPVKESHGIIASSENNKDAVNETSVLNIDPKEWSRGNLSVGNTLLQPVKLLPPSSAHKPGKRPPSPSTLIDSGQPRRKSAKLTILSNQATLFDMMISQKVKEPESPFTHFYQEKSPGLSQEFPNEDETKLKKRLTEEWENMTDDERMSYREKCWYDTKRYEKDKMSFNKQCDIKCTPGTDTKPNKKTSEKLKKTLKKRLYGKECSIKIPMNEIRNSRQAKATSNNDDDLKIIGFTQDSDDVCLCTIHNKLYVVNAWRLSETSLYKKLKAEHVLTAEPCDPVVLDSRTINEQGMLALESLAKKCQGVGTYFHISDKRLVANGFNVKCHCDPNGNVSCQLVGICRVIPAYDVKDLNVVLGVIHADKDSSLSKTRTLKAAFYLQGEAVRMARQSAGRKSLHDIQSLLKGAKNKTDQPCLHHKPIFQELFDLSSCDLDDD